jgi:hypothetical protein
MRTPVLLFAFTASLSVYAQQVRPPAALPTPSSTIRIDRTEGAPVQVPLGFGIVLNRESTLNREWFAVNDSLAPLNLDSIQGINVVYKPGERSSRGEYQYVLSYRLTPKEPVTAFEVRAVVIDVFGRLVRTLSATELVNLQQPKDFRAEWRIFSENEASEAFASVVYVAQVRTASGRVYVADRTKIFDQIRGVATRLTEADLEPKRDAPPSR